MNIDENANSVANKKRRSVILTQPLAKFSGIKSFEQNDLVQGILKEIKMFNKDEDDLKFDIERSPDLRSSFQKQYREGLNARKKSY